MISIWSVSRLVNLIQAPLKLSFSQYLHRYHTILSIRSSGDGGLTVDFVIYGNKKLILVSMNVFFICATNKKQLKNKHKKPEVDWFLYHLSLQFQNVWVLLVVPSPFSVKENVITFLLIGPKFLFYLPHTVVKKILLITILTYWTLCKVTCFRIYELNGVRTEICAAKYWRFTSKLGRKAPQRYIWSRVSPLVLSEEFWNLFTNHDCIIHKIFK